jgi:hypothetical protein
MGRAGREHVVAHFDPAQQWARYVALFDAMLARRRATGRHRHPAPAPAADPAAPAAGPATDPATDRAPRIPHQRSADPNAQHSADKHSAGKRRADNEREVV